MKSVCKLHKLYFLNSWDRYIFISASRFLIFIAQEIKWYNISVQESMFSLLFTFLYCLSLAYFMFSNLFCFYMDTNYSSVLYPFRNHMYLGVRNVSRRGVWGHPLLNPKFSGVTGHLLFKLKTNTFLLLLFPRTKIHLTPTYSSMLFKYFLVFS